MSCTLILTGSFCHLHTHECEPEGNTSKWKVLRVGFLLFWWLQINSLLPMTTGWLSLFVSAHLVEGHQAAAPGSRPGSATSRDMGSDLTSRSLGFLLCKVRLWQVTTESLWGLTVGPEADSGKRLGTPHLPPVLGQRQGPNHCFASRRSAHWSERGQELTEVFTLGHWWFLLRFTVIGLFCQHWHSQVVTQRIQKSLLLIATALHDLYCEWIVFSGRIWAPTPPRAFIY